MHMAGFDQGASSFIYSAQTNPTHLVTQALRRSLKKLFIVKYPHQSKRQPKSYRLKVCDHLWLTAAERGKPNMLLADIAEPDDTKTHRAG
jgi:hypothetical protein